MTTTVAVDSAESRQFRHDLWFTRFYYLFWFGGSAFVNPFLNRYYLSLGITGTQIGLMGSIVSIVTIVTAPFWTSRSERWQHPRLMLQFFLIITAVSFFLLSQQVAFLGIALITIFRTLTTSSLYPLSDAMTLRVTKASDAGFGSVRVFGSLGWMIFGLMSGWIVERLGLQFSLVGAGILSAVAAGVLLFISASHFTINREKPKTARPNLRMIIPRLKEQPMLIGLALMIVLMGLGNSGVGQFWPTYVEQLGARDSLIAAIAIFSAVVELPFMFLADYLMKRHGTYRLLLLAMMIYTALRLMVFLIPAIPTIMFEQAMNGICYSFVTIGIVRFISEQTEHEGETRMMLAFFTVTITSITAIVSAPVAGTLFDHFGTHMLYAVSAIGYTLAGLSLYIAAQFQGKIKKFG